MALTFKAVGSWAVIQGAAREAREMPPTRIRPVQSIPWRGRNRRSRRNRASRTATASQADTRVGQGVSGVGQQVAGQGQHRAEHQIAHDERIIPGHDRLVKQLPQPRQGENGFDDDRTTDEPGHGQAQDGDDRKQGVAQGVPVDDHVFGQALGPGGQDVVLAQHLEHGRAQKARHAGQTPEGINEYGQQQMPAQVGQLAQGRKHGIVHGGQAGNRQYGPVDAEKEHEQQGQPEAGHGEADKDQHRGGAVEQSALAPGRDDADGHGDGQGEHQRNDVHGKGQGQPLADLVPDGPVVAGEGLAEVEADELAEPIHILHGQRPVEPIELFEPGPGFGRGQGIERGLHVRGRARSQMDDGEADEGDAEKDGGHPEDFPQQAFDQGEHVYRTPWGAFSGQTPGDLYGKRVRKKRVRKKVTGPGKTA